jgi:hypothetical protein
MSRPSLALWRVCDAKRARLALSLSLGLLTSACGAPVTTSSDAGSSDASALGDTHAPPLDAEASRDAGLDAAGPDASLPPPADWMSSGTVHTCASLGGRVSCWGRLWDVATNVPLEIPELRSAASVDISHQTACARWDDGRVACAGENRAGLLGTLDVASSASFVRVAEIDDAIDLALGTSFACVLRSSGTVWCWGDDSVGQTGRPIPDHRTGSYAPQPTPLPVEGLDGVLDVEAGSSFACALRDSGEVVCWGSDAWGALGRGAGYTGRAQPLFAPIEGVGDARSLEAQGNGGCVIRADDTTWCWGGHVYHYPGFDRATEDHCAVVVEQSCWRAPRAISIEPATEVVLGGERGCARGASAWRCFGNDEDRSLPEVGSPIDATDDVALGGRFTCTRDGEHVRCRGRGDAGQLGDGLATNSAAWVDVDLSP